MKYLLDTNICAFHLRGKLIGATAIKNNMIPVTDNLKDFKCLEGIRIENWMKR
jgi:predicted nucleic acid-binding protein